MKILLAEDEKALSDAEVAVLRHFGYEVDAAYDGLSAWQMAEREAYDCIVLDIMMPKMDDYLTKPFAMGEFLARIRSMKRRANAFTPAVLSAGGVTLNVEEQELSAESAIRLGSKETKLMKYFMMNAGKALTQEEILRYVWSDEPDVPADIVWMYISFLKEKLAAVRGKAVIEGEKEGPFALRAMGD